MIDFAKQRGVIEVHIIICVSCMYYILSLKDERMQQEVYVT